MSSVEDKGTLASAMILRQQLPRYRSATVQALFTSTKICCLYSRKNSPSEGAMPVLSLLPGQQRQRWPRDGLTSCTALRASLRMLQDLIFQAKPGIKLHQMPYKSSAALSRPVTWETFFPCLMLQKTSDYFWV